MDTNKPDFVQNLFDKTPPRDQKRSLREIG
jgi:hypothetical protein